VCGKLPVTECVDRQTFTVDLAVLVVQCRRIKRLVTFLTTEAASMPILSVHVQLIVHWTMR